MTRTEQELKSIVKDRYAGIAQQGAAVKASACCSTQAQPNKVYNIMMEDYAQEEGYVPDADLGLGCGLPTQFARIQKGNVVIDLGSGAGNDCFVARHETGPEGKVIGIDFTPEMVQKARANAEKMGFHNVEFREGDIDHMPVNDNVADVVVSNCVLNLVPNKPQVMQEIYRVLKPGGHFSISDIVISGSLPAALKADAEMYAGCIAGAIQKADYLQLLQQAGFEHITIQKQKTIAIPEAILSQYLSATEQQDFLQGNTGIFSITVYGEKPGATPLPAIQDKAALETGTCCQPSMPCC